LARPFSILYHSSLLLLESVLEYTGFFLFIAVHRLLLEACLSADKVSELQDCRKTNVIGSTKHRNIIRSFISQIYEGLRTGDCHHYDKNIPVTIY
jgi:hypothetical protein